MLRLYHNPRCSKSRAALARLQDAGADIEVIQYLRNPLQINKIKELIAKLDVPAAELLRDRAAGEAADDKAVIAALLADPKRLQRPLIEDDSRAIIARPPERVDEFLPGTSAS